MYSRSSISQLLLRKCNQVGILTLLDNLVLDSTLPILLLTTLKSLASTTMISSKLTSDCVLFGDVLVCMYNSFGKLF